jgi:transmembrane sensor
MLDNYDSEWEKIAAKIHGELSSEEEATFDQMMTDESSLYGFEKSQQIHENLVKAGPVPQNGRTNSWSAIEKGIRIYQLRWVKVVLKYAAIIILAFIAGRQLIPSPLTDKEIRYSEIIVPFGEMSQVKLSDGTKIWLNSGTTLRYPEHFSLAQRSVEVIGEAYFEVAKMANKTFTVNTADMKVEVLGTSFNVLAYKEDTSTQITLVEGKVVLQNTEGKAIAKLTPGQMATKNKSGTKVKIKNVQTDFYAEWTQGKIFFDDEPLDQIAVKLERWFNVQIIFANENLKSHRFTGTILKNKPVDQIMQALELLSPITFTHQVNATGRDKITIYKRI